jgi:adenylate kinase family enzyme
MSKILITGMPLSGKTTQAKRLSKELEFRVIDFNSLIKNSRDFNKELKSSFCFYNTLPKELKTSLKYLISSEDNLYSIFFRDNYILDGLMIDYKDKNFLLKNNLINTVLFLNISEKESFKRLEFIQNFGYFKLKYSSLYHKKRLEIFYDNTLEAIDSLKKSKKITCYEINGEDTIENVHKEIFSILN